MIRSLGLCLGLALLLGACNSTGIGNPGTITQGLEIAPDPKAEPDSQDDDEQLDQASLLHVVLVVGEFRFLACDTNEDDAVLLGPYVVDLIEDRIRPELDEVPIPEGGFCGIDATLAPAKRPPSLAGRSFFFSGVRGDETLFLVFANMTGTLRLRPFEDTAWPFDGDHRWIWALRPRRWLLPTELDQAEPEALDDVERVIAIDADNHPWLYDAIRARLAGRSSLHLDLNDNQRLDTEERTGDALIGQGLDSLD